MIKIIMVEKIPKTAEDAAASSHSRYQKTRASSSQENEPEGGKDQSVLARKDSTLALVEFGQLPEGNRRSEEARRPDRAGSRTLNKTWFDQKSVAGRNGDNCIVLLSAKSSRLTRTLTNFYMKRFTMQKSSDYQRGSFLSECI